MIKKIINNRKKEKNNSMLFFIKKHKLTIIILMIIIITAICAFFCKTRFFYTPIKKENLCIAQFETNGGTVLDDSFFDCGSKIQEPESPKKEGFIFKYWKTDDSKFNFNSKVSSNITLHAYYEPESGTDIVIVSFDTNGGTNIEPIEIKKGTKISAPVNPQKKGYTFAGWLYNEKIFNFETMIDEDITLYANWIINNSNNSLENNNATLTIDNCSFTDNSINQTMYNMDLFDDWDNRIYFWGYFTAPANYTSGCNIKYSSSDKTIATVDNDGLITILKPGKVDISSCVYSDKTKIKCYTGHINAKTYINEDKNPPIPYDKIKGRWYAKYSNVEYVEFSNYREDEYSISIDWMFVGIDINTLHYSCMTGKCINTDKYPSGSGSSYASLNHFEKTYSMKIEGNKLYLSKNGNTVEFSRNPANVPVDNINLSLTMGGINYRDSYDMYVDNENVLCYTIAPINSDNKLVEWKNSNNEVSSVIDSWTDENYGCIRIKGMKKGKSTYTATVKGTNISDSFIINVIDNNIYVTGISLSNSEIYLNVGDKKSLSATFTPYDATNKTILWSSDNNSVASVDNKGNVVAVAPGKATISVVTEDGGYTSKCVVTVKKLPLSVDASAGLTTTCSIDGCGEYVFVELNATGGTAPYTYYVDAYRNGQSVGTINSKAGYLPKIPASYVFNWTVTDINGETISGTKSFTYSIS